ncbi:MauE/DoxX family redox-associated membrane protein [Nonomuraea sp. LPB2021202275-12-8]|uniref:MauE/DoxX family redox-associated membrane protein n=1 Tax=Nonomuraea sp. LPB2021202275-12-8 TaxID=3120159 RepID=UPI00300D1C49
MGLNEWLLTCANAAAAALLLNSGLAKAVAPDVLRRALTEVVPSFAGANAPVMVRVLAAVEIAAAAALLLAPTRMAAALLATLLGAGFAAFGLLGKLRGSSTPCGCFGASDRQPLGWTNVALGVLLATVLPLNAANGPATPTDYTAGALMLAATGTLLLCGYTHRRVVRRHLVVRLRRPKPTH